MISVGMKCTIRISSQLSGHCENEKLLHYYRPDLDLYLETDASSVAIGMALLQSETNDRESLYQITYDSKTLTDAETRYVNIE